MKRTLATLTAVLMLAGAVPAMEAGAAPSPREPVAQAHSANWVPGSPPLYRERLQFCGDGSFIYQSHDGQYRSDGTWRVDDAYATDNGHLENGGRLEATVTGIVPNAPDTTVEIVLVTDSFGNYSTSTVNGVSVRADDADLCS